jgi:hypothetical protein
LAALKPLQRLCAAGIDNPTAKANKKGNRAGVGGINFVVNISQVRPVSPTDEELRALVTYLPLSANKG